MVQVLVVHLICVRGFALELGLGDSVLLDVFAGVWFVSYEPHGCGC